MKPLPKLFGRIVAIDGRQQTVDVEGGHHGGRMFLTIGVNGPRDARVGDRVEMEYRSTARLGLWYARVLAPEVRS